MLKMYIEDLAEKISYGIDFGLSIEIKDFFKNDKRIAIYKIEIIEKKKYKIFVKLNKCNSQEVKKVFFDFLHFIEYPAISFYVRSINKENIEYLLFSGDGEKLGFYCQILFDNKDS